MAEIPSDISSSAAQAGFQANEVSKEREARRTGNIQGSNRQVKSLDEAGETVETKDADTAIFTDAEGTGSEGRENEEDTKDQPEDSDAAENGITTDGDGQLHVDLEA